LDFLIREATPTVLTFGRRLAHLEERLAQDDEPFKNAGCFRLGDLRDGSTDFASIEEMILAVDRAAAAPELFFETASLVRAAVKGPNGMEFWLTRRVPSHHIDSVPIEIYRSSVKPQRAVIVVPHWNSRPGSYRRFATALVWAGFSVYVLTLPYHGSRSSSGLEQIANDFLNADLGAAIRSVRQAVGEVRLLTAWLLTQGAAEVQVVGLSLGSCVAALVAAFEPHVKSTVLLLSAGDFAETVWTGRATRHIRKAVEGHISLVELKRVWSIISPSTFITRFRQNESRLLMINGQIDRVVPLDLTARFVEELRASGVELRWRVLPCGHYTLGVFPFSIVSVVLSIAFLRKEMRY
jgi:pimeloyl-ACP methyl ester carboxylesterase